MPAPRKEQLRVDKRKRIRPGYRIQGYLQHDHTYDLPPGFYDTASGKNTANFGIFANENFQGTGQGYNGLAQSRIPYSGGYGELNYRLHSNAFSGSVRSITAQTTPTTARPSPS